MSDLILYTTDDGRTQLHLRVEGDSIWLSQLEIAELFQTTKQNVSLHAKNIFEDGELRQDSVVKESLTTAADGKNYRTKLYNLDLILAIGYRVRGELRVVTNGPVRDHNANQVLSDPEPTYIWIFRNIDDPPARLIIG